MSTFDRLTTQEQIPITFENGETGKNLCDKMLKLITWLEENREIVIPQELKDLIQNSFRPRVANNKIQFGFLPPDNILTMKEADVKSAIVILNDLIANYSEILTSGIHQETGFSVVLSYKVCCKADCFGCEFRSSNSDETN